MVSINQPLDLDDPDASGFLDGIQGNILKPHARDHALHLLVRFGGDQAACRRWIVEFSRTHLTSAQTQRQQTANFKAQGDGGTFANLALSASGYRALGIAAIPSDPRFSPGMKNSADLGSTDPPPATWEGPFRGDLHALVILADQNPDRLSTVAAAVIASLGPLADLVQQERGDAITRDDPRSGPLNLIHFGYADGISQPLTILQDIETQIARRGRAKWDPAAPLRLLLGADPTGGWGSYLVFRKLEQNVDGFLKAEAALADQLGLAGAARKRAEAMIVGRYRDGYPAIAAPAEPDASPGNDFSFDDDRFGAVCPYQAHIRKTNPRGDLASAGAGRPPIPRGTERDFRIGRRGIPYGSGDYMTTGAPPPKDGVGLLFMCVASNLNNFEIQQAGSDSGDFPTVGIGVDATIGRDPSAAPQTWIVPTDGTSTATVGEVKFSIANFVTLRGGEYFFLPSMGFFRTLAGP
jgi:deferrochelatase/peroxidase EfeB